MTFSESVFLIQKLFVHPRDIKKYRSKSYSKKVTGMLIFAKQPITVRDDFWPNFRNTFRLFCL